MFHCLRTILSATLLGLSVTTAQADPHLIINGDTVYDKKTGLTWQRCSVGMRWNADTNLCVGTQKEMTFDEAKRGWSNGWRVPTKDELASLIGRANKEAFPDTWDRPNEIYWSSTPGGATRGWAVFFYYGDTYSANRSYTYAVRGVRGGQ